MRCPPAFATFILSASRLLARPSQTTPIRQSSDVHRQRRLKRLVIIYRAAESHPYLLSASTAAHPLHRLTFPPESSHRPLRLCLLGCLLLSTQSPGLSTTRLYCHKLSVPCVCITNRRQAEGLCPLICRISKNERMLYGQYNRCVIAKTMLYPSTFSSRLRSKLDLQHIAISTFFVSLRGPSTGVFSSHSWSTK